MGAREELSKELEAAQRAHDEARAEVNRAADEYDQATIRLGQQRTRMSDAWRTVLRYRGAIAALTADDDEVDVGGPE